MRKSVGEASR